MNLQKPKFVENVSCIDLNQKDMIKLLQSKTLKQMINLCIRKNGIGLAAIQVGIRLKFFVAYRNEKDGWCLFMNPKYDSNSEKIKTIEGCLTYGKDKFEVERYKKITASWDEIDKDGNIIKKSEELTDTFSQIFQHECDHVNNITISKIGKKK
jgi:peptide deformylase